MEDNGTWTKNRVVVEVNAVAKFHRIRSGMALNATVISKVSIKVLAIALPGEPLLFCESALPATFSIPVLHYGVLRDQITGVC